LTPALLLFVGTILAASHVVAGVLWYSRGRREGADEMRHHYGPELVNLREGAALTHDKLTTVARLAREEGEKIGRMAGDTEADARWLSAVAQARRGAHPSGQVRRVLDEVVDEATGAGGEGVGDGR